MRFLVECASKATGADVYLAVEATDAIAAEEWAIAQGFLVSSVSVDETESAAASTQPSAWQPIERARSLALASYTTEWKLERTGRIIRHGTNYLLAVWTAWTTICILIALSIGGHIFAFTKAFGPAPVNARQLPRDGSGGVSFVGAVDALLGLLIPTTMIATWLAIPVVIFVLGRFAEFHMLAHADLVRLGKRRVGLPYAQVIRGSE